MHGINKHMRDSKYNEYIELCNRLSKNIYYVEAYDFANTDIIIEFNVPAKYIRIYVIA